MIKIEERIYLFVSIYFYLKIFDNQRIIREKKLVKSVCKYYSRDNLTSTLNILNLK